MPYKKPRETRRGEIHARRRRDRPHTKNRGKLAVARFILAAGEIVLRRVVGEKPISPPARYRYIRSSRAARSFLHHFLCIFSRFPLYPLKIFTSNLPKTFILPSLSSLYLKTSIYYSDLLNFKRFWASISIFVRIWVVWKSSTSKYFDFKVLFLFICVALWINFST